jgi:hypothetical protein
MVESVQDREAAVAIREADVARREADLSLRRASADAILAAAVLRDLDADERDRASVLRDQLAYGAEFLAQSARHHAGDAWARRSAALDRDESRDDRSWAAADRLALTE